MSDQLENHSSPIEVEIVQRIQELDLPSIQKHHVRLLTHCLAIFKNIALSNDGLFPNDALLKNWCESEAKKINDITFSDLLFDQMTAAARKLEIHSEKISKSKLDFNLDDLVNLVCENY